MPFVVLLALAALRPARACDPVTAIPDALQVAWVSPLPRRVGASAWLEVVRVQDLRAWVTAHGRDPVRVLQALGMVGPKGRGHAATRPYKVTLFDVEGAWLCRPVEGAAPGAPIEGVAGCEEAQQSRTAGHAWSPGFGGCGYTVDQHGGGRGLDVFRVRWSDASAHGFCVMPFDRFLTGA